MLTFNPNQPMVQAPASLSSAALTEPKPITGLGTMQGGLGNSMVPPGINPMNANYGQQLSQLANGVNSQQFGPSQMLPSNMMPQQLMSQSFMNSPQNFSGSNGGVRFPQQQLNPMNAVSTQQIQAQGLNQFNPTQPGLNNGSNGGIRLPSAQATPMNIGSMPAQFQPQSLNQISSQQGINPQQIVNAPGMQQPSLQMNSQVSPGFIQNAPPGLAPSANVFNQSPQMNPGSIQNAPPGMAPSANLFNNTPTQSVEQQALGGGSNAQQVQNFMQALQGVGAGSNNTFQNNPSNNPQTQQAQNLYPGGAQSSNASSSNNVQGYYNTGTGNMQQSSSNNWNQGGQVNGNSTPSMANNVNSGWQPNGGSSTSGTASTGSLNPTQMYNGGQAVAGLGTTNNSLTNQNPSQAAQAGSNGGYRPPGGFGNQIQSNPSQIQHLNAPAGLGSAGLNGLVSDQNAKENITPGKKDLNSFLSNLGAHSYTYKNPEHGQGTFVSPMAQELEKSKLGKSMVETRPDGLKQVNYGRGFGIITAAQSLMHQRLAQIEKSLKIKG